MNKFAALALLALCAVAAANPIVPEDIEEISESYLHPDDNEEIVKLEGEKQMFADFCISSRDYIYSDIKSNTNGLAGTVFRYVFSSAEAVGKEALDTQRMAVDRLSNQIAHPDAEIAAATNTVEEMVAEGQKKIQEEQTQPRTFLTAFISTITATKNVVGEHLSAGFKAIAEKAGLDQAINMLEGACNKIAAYETELRGQFDAYKKNVQDKPALAALTIEQVPCVTSIRIIRADGACKFAKAAQAPFTKLMTTARKN